MQKTRDHPNSRSGYVKEDVLKAISGFFIILAFIAVISLFAGMGGSSGGTTSNGSTDSNNSSSDRKIIFVVNDVVLGVSENTTWGDLVADESSNSLGFTIVDDNVYLDDSKVVDSETNLPVTPDMPIDSNIEYKDESFTGSNEVLTLSPPSISLSDSVLTIIDTSGLATNYNIYSNGTCIAGTVANFSTIDLADLIDESGTYSITVTAVSDGYEESEQSNAVEYVVSGATTTPPTNLTGYTVTVPAGWAATAGYGQFDVNFTISGVEDAEDWEFNHLGIGFSYREYDDYLNEADCVIFYNNLGQIRSTFNGFPFSVSFLGGTDASNSSLIQCFVDNNATFTKTATTPTLISFTIGNRTYQAEEGMTWADWCASEYNTDGWYEHPMTCTPSDGYVAVTLVTMEDEIIADTEYFTGSLPEGPG